MFESSGYARFELCECCEFSGPHGHVMASDGSHSCTLQSKHQARLALRFLEDHDHITEDEFLLVNEQISKSPLRELSSTDVGFRMMLARLGDSIDANEYLLERGIAPPGLRPWEIGFPGSLARDFLLAPKSIEPLVRELFLERNPDLPTIISQSPAIISISPVVSLVSETTMGDFPHVLVLASDMPMGLPLTSDTETATTYTSALAGVTISSSGMVVANSPSPFAVANDLDPEDPED